MFYFKSSLDISSSKILFSLTEGKNGNSDFFP